MLRPVVQRHQGPPAASRTITIPRSNLSSESSPDASAASTESFKYVKLWKGSRGRSLAMIMLTSHCQTPRLVSRGSMTQRMTKQEAGAQLGVSPSTIDRMIRRQELATEKERHGSRYRVWVLMDDNDVSDVSPGQSGDRLKARHDQADQSDDNADKSYASPESSDLSLIVELSALRERTRNAEELAEYRGELLKEAELRYHALLQELSSAHRTVETLSRALPAPAETPEATPRQNWWWPFRRGQR